MKTALNIPDNNNKPTGTFIKIAALIIVTLLTLSYKGNCADSANLIKSKNAFYASITTQGNNPSINYERIFRQGRTFSYSCSAGFSASGKSVSVPFSVNAITTGKQHHLEISLGVTPHMQQHTYLKKKADQDKQVYVKPSVGYRYQKSATGLFFKAGVGPQVLIDPPAFNIMSASVTLVKPSAQIALGISF